MLPASVLRGLSRVKTGRPRYPSAATLAHLVVARAERGEIGHPDEVRPSYMREPDVTLGSVHRREGGLWR